MVLEAVGNCITALCTQPGRVVLTQFRIYFQPFNVVSNAPIQTYQLDKVRGLSSAVDGRVGGWRWALGMDAAQVKREWHTLCGTWRIDTLPPAPCMQ